MRASRPFLFIVLAVSLNVQVAAGESDAWVAQGEALLEEGKIPQAEETLQRAVAEDPGSSLAYIRLGGAQLLGQKYAAAIESFKQAVSLDPESADAFVGMAIAYIHSGRYPLARAALMEAKRIDPSKQQDADDLIAWIDTRMGKTLAP